MTTTTHEISDIFNQYGYLIEESTNKMLISPSEEKKYFALIRSLVGLSPIKMQTNSLPFACAINHKVRLLDNDKDTMTDVPVSFCKFFNNIIDSDTEYDNEFLDVASDILKEGKPLDKIYDLETEGGTDEVHKLHMLTSVVYGNTSEGSTSLLIGKLISYALDKSLDEFQIEYLTEEEYNGD